jgi:hypothetical protein
MSATAQTPRPANELLRAVPVFAATLAALLAALLASAVVFADLGALWPEGGVARLARFCFFLSLITAYVAAAIVASRRGASRDFAALRGVTDTTPESWARWEVRFRDGRADGLASAAGFAVGLGIDRIGAALGPPDGEAWVGLSVWAALLNALLFAGLGVLVRRSVLEIRALRAIGRRVRVSLLDRAPLAPFVRTGLRGAVLWLIGSSLATTLLFDVNAPWLVLAVLVLTMGLGVAALLLPSRGLHERLRAARDEELAWVHSEIARARGALAGCDAASREDAARLPALLAWEARVAQVSAWPFDAPTLVRFALFLLVPLGSWLGGALVERAVDALME